MPRSLIEASEEFNRCSCSNDGTMTPMSSMYCSSRVSTVMVKCFTVRRSPPELLEDKIFRRSCVVTGSASVNERGESSRAHRPSNAGELSQASGGGKGCVHWDVTSWVLSAHLTETLSSSTSEASSAESHMPGRVGVCGGDARGAFILPVGVSSSAERKRKQGA